MTDKGASLFVKILVVLVIIVISYFSIKRQNKEAIELKEQGRYVIGKTEGMSFNHRSSGYHLKYSYRVRGILYRDGMTIKSLKDVKTKGAEYIVMFDPQNPKNSKLILNMPIIFHPAVIEDTGWTVVPDFILHYKNDSLKITTD